MPSWMPEFLQGIAGEILVAIIIFATGLLIWGKIKDKWTDPTASF